MPELAEHRFDPVGPVDLEIAPFARAEPLGVALGEFAGDRYPEVASLGQKRLVLGPLLANLAAARSPGSRRSPITARDGTGERA